jgi:hypothetical protein
VLEILIFCPSGANGFGGSCGGLTPEADLARDLSIGGDTGPSSGGKGGMGGGSRPIAGGGPGRGTCCTGGGSARAITGGSRANTSWRIGRNSTMFDRCYHSQHLNFE